MDQSGLKNGTNAFGLAFSLLALQSDNRMNFPVKWIGTGNLKRVLS